jgi:hypothetical protein
VRLGAKVGGRYRLTRGPIHGGTGEVWLAHDEELGRRVILKSVAGAGSDAGFDRLKAEARVLARFSHPHVVTLFDAVRVGKRADATSWLVMEYAPGGSLDRRPPLSPRLAAHIGAQLTDALVALHGMGIVHCDIKPGNVVVTHGSTVKLADFGAAYRVGDQNTITPNSAVSYTPDYASPEVVKGQPEPASDVFSIAATVYALVAGEPLGHDGDGEPDAYIRHRRAARGDVELTADVGPLREVLVAMLRRDPKDRPDPAEAGELLRSVAGPRRDLPELPLPSKDGGRYAEEPVWPADGTGRTPAGIAGFVRRHQGRAVAVAVAVVVLLGVGTGWWALSHGSGRRTAGGSHPAPAPRTSSVATAKPRSASVIGDHRTADPCALLNPAALSRFGDAQLDPAYGNFDRCDVVVSAGAPSGIVIEVEFGEVSGPRSPASAPASGRVSVLKPAPSSSECDRTLVLSGDGDVNVFVTAKTVSGSETASPSLLRAMADAGTDSAAKALNAVPAGRTIARRTTPFPAGSLYYKDACTLLTPHALEVVPGVDADHPELFYGHWECRWTSTTRAITVDLIFDRGSQLNAADDGTPTRLGGRRAFIALPGAEGNSSVVKVFNRSYTAVGGEPEDEVLQLTVDGSGSGPASRQRTMATQLAAAAATALSAG